MSKEGRRHIRPDSSILSVLLIVKTGPGYFKRRQITRDLWFSRCTSGDLFGDSKSLNWTEHQLLKDVNVECLFLAGVSEKKDVMEALRKEKETKGDIFLAPFVDNYHRMTAKTQWTLLWSLQREKPYDYIMLVDDDTYIVFRQLLPWLLRQPRQRLYSGHRHGNNNLVPVVLCSADPRNPNCIKKLPAFLKGRSTYAPFAAGFAYVLSRDVVSLVVQDALQYITDGDGLPGNVEDAMVGGLANSTGVSLRDEPGFIHYMDEKCSADTLILVLGNAPSRVLVKMMVNEEAGKPVCFQL
ncbi:lactosylceramide 1,3-N-acetyl-beta-D-glucosaminyltransferase A-like [Sycon ciliatum]|uniref:lactosylceramide 1,3-N-acetyl-beta-D-glucosaminyltransferase A-like n=1 Tax=Sycon ciliatum TaxID=27933 RepID=UPI0031F707B5